MNDSLKNLVESLGEDGKLVQELMSCPLPLSPIGNESLPGNSRSLKNTPKVHPSHTNKASNDTQTSSKHSN